MLNNEQIEKRISAAYQEEFQTGAATQQGRLSTNQNRLKEALAQLEIRQNQNEARMAQIRELLFLFERHPEIARAFELWEQLY